MISIFSVCLFHLLQIQYPVAQHFRAKNHFLLNAPLCCISLLRKHASLNLSYRIRCPQVPNIGKFPIFRFICRFPSKNNYFWRFWAKKLLFSTIYERKMTIRQKICRLLKIVQALIDVLFPPRKCAGSYRCPCAGSYRCPCAGSYRRPRQYMFI